MGSNRCHHLGALDGVGKPCGDSADERASVARVFCNRARRLYVAWHCVAYRSKLSRASLLRHHLCADSSRSIWCCRRSRGRDRRRYGLRLFRTQSTSTGTVLLYVDLYVVAGGDSAFVWFLREILSILIRAELYAGDFGSSLAGGIGYCVQCGIALLLSEGFEVHLCHEPVTRRTPDSRLNSSPDGFMPDCP